MILIDREIEVAQQIDPKFNSYKEAEELQEDLKEKLVRLRSQTTDEVFQPSDIREAADLVNTGYLTTLKYLRLRNLDLSSSDEAYIKSLLSVCTDSVYMDKVRGCGLIIKHVNSKELWIRDQTLSVSETADLVTSMRDRVEMVVMESDVTLDVETVDRMIGELRQGKCREISCFFNTADKYREHLTRWADSIGWRTEDRRYNICIYRRFTLQ